jgi:spore coat protein U-like protein
MAKCLKSATSKVALLLILLLNQNSFAATATTSFLVSATVLTACIVVATPLAFGNYDPTSATALAGTSTVSVTCTLSAPYNIGLDAGGGSGATVTVRKMTRTVGGAQTLNYGLYQDSGHATVWGNTIGTNTVAVTGSGLLQATTVYGLIPVDQASPAAVYNDTINVTVTY